MPTDIEQNQDPTAARMEGSVPSLVDLCVQKAKQNVRHLGNVGETELFLLDRILPHCTMEQLAHVENCTRGRDLSPVTDKLWKKFYERQFGAKSVELVMERMKNKKVECKWSELYKAKTRDLEEKEKEASERFKGRYAEEAARKRKREIQMCTNVPHSRCKKNLFGDHNKSTTKKESRIMEKAKKEFENCLEVKNLVALKNMKAVERSKIGVSSALRPCGFPSVCSFSAWKAQKPAMLRRF